MRCRLRLTCGQMYLQGWDLESGWHLVRWSLWDENLGQVRLTFCQMRLRVRLTFDQMAGWLANCSWMAGYWTKCHLCIDVKDRHPTRSHLGSGWHDFRWLGGWPIAAGWLTISKNVNLTLPWGSDFGFGSDSLLACQLQLADWPLTKCHSEPGQVNPSPKDVI